MSENRLEIVILVAGVILLMLLSIGSTVGTASGIYAAIFLVHLAAIIAALFFSIQGLVTTFRQTPLLGKGSLIIGAAALLMALLEASLPVTFRDSLIHHLAVPQWWVEAGHIYSPVWHEWSFYPMLINLGYAGLITLGAEGLAGSYNWVLSLLFCAVIATGTSKLSESKTAGALAFLVAATLPIVHRLAPLPTADMGLALFSAIAFFLLIECLTKSTLQRKERDQQLILTGIAFGLALGCKYNALPFTAFSLLLMVLFLARQGTFFALRSVALVGVTALVVYSPWLLRNFVLTNNPIYPLYSNIFEPSIERPAGLPNLKPLEQRSLIYKESPLEIALLPLRIFVQGSDNLPAHFDGALSPLLLLGFLGCLILKREKGLRYGAMLTLLVIVVSIFLNPLRVRYLAPLFAPLIFMCALTAEHFLNSSRLLRGATIVALTAHLFLFWSYAVPKAQAEKLIGYLNGSISSEQYLSERIAEYPMIDYVNREISPDRTIYLLFTGNRFALYKPNTFSGGHYSASVLIDWIRQSERTGRPLIQFFREHPVDFILADSERSQSFALEQLNEAERHIWTTFITEHLRFVHEQRGFSLWQITQ